MAPLNQGQRIGPLPFTGFRRFDVFEGKSGNLNDSTMPDLSWASSAGDMVSNLSDMLKDPSVTGRGWAVTQVSRGRSQRQGGRFYGYSLRTPRWRYTDWAQGEQGRELYDHDADPRELTNLAGNRKYAATIRKLSGQLREAVRQTFPASGKTPALRPATWAPNLTNP